MTIKVGSAFGVVVESFLFWPVSSVFSVLCRENLYIEAERYFFSLKFREFLHQSLLFSLK